MGFRYLSRLGHGLVLAWVLVLSSPARSQVQPLDTYDQLLQRLGSIAKLERTAALAAAAVLMQELTTAGRIPFCEGERALLLYSADPEAPPSSVTWLGDFNGWSPTPEDQGTPVGLSGLWRLEKRFPSDTRLDYKLFLNGKQWILDPANARHQLGGFGPNNVLAMPEYRADTMVLPQPGAKAGTLTSDRIHSNLLGYDVNYLVYLPAGHQELGPLPSLYVMDGQEYAEPQMGAMVQVLDNLIGQGRIPAVYVVFVDPRDPKRSDNRRLQEYGHGYGLYSRFLCDELVAAVDQAYATRRDPGQRAIMGTSLGGLFSAYCLVAHADVFQLAGIHSPAFGFDAQHAREQDPLSGPVLELWRKTEQLQGRAFVLTGTVSDVQETADPFVALLQRRGIKVVYHVVHDGHSWGNWRSQIDDTLTHLFPLN